MAWRILPMLKRRSVIGTMDNYGKLCLMPTRTYATRPANNTPYLLRPVDPPNEHGIETGVGSLALIAIAIQVA
jgi:hypothetical protein